jgi:sporulation protein YqfC
MKRQYRFINSAAAAADLPSEPFPRQALVELLGEDRVLVENHRGIAEYGNEKIGVKTKYGEVSISGINLELICMTRCQLVIKGRINSIELHRKG